MEKARRGDGCRKRRFVGTSLVACVFVVAVVVACGARRADAFLVRKECFLSRSRSTWTATTLSYLEKKHEDEIVGAGGVPSSSSNDDDDEAKETTSVETPPVSPRRSRRRRRGAPPVAVRNPYNIPSDPDERWDFFYRHFLEHWLERGHTMVRPGIAVNESLLRNWVAEQRRGYMRVLGIIEGNRTISIDRKIELDRIGFDWGQFGAVSKEQTRREKKLLRRLERPSYEASEDDDDDVQWAAYYARLADFFVTRGHSHVPSVDPDLGRWTWSLRRTAPKKLSDRRREALANVNFYFFKEPKWTQYLSRLKSFQDQHGHSDVPADRDPRLAEWVAKQRKAHRYYRAGKRSPINEKRIKALDNAGFDWGQHDDPSKEDVESRKA